jgi:hypothetical protein
VNSFDRETRAITSLLEDLKGLVVAQRVLEARGVSSEELERHEQEIDRVRARLAEAVRSSGGGVESVAA